MEILRPAMARIVHNYPVAPGCYRMGLSPGVDRVEPGQFVMIRIPGGLDPLLRRPFSVYNVLRGRGGGIEIVYKVVGRGTGMMASLGVGDEVDVLGPLGRGFPMPGKKERVVMVAGGVGVASLHLLAKRIGYGTLLFGGRNRRDARLAGDFRDLMEVKIVTEDGSMGRKGFVTEFVEEEIGEEGTVVYACGPSAMLEKVSCIAMDRGVRCYVSLEGMMACGMGVCLGCAVKADGAYRMVCSDGPVFRCDEIDWQGMDG